MTDIAETYTVIRMNRISSSIMVNLQIPLECDYVLAKIFIIVADLKGRCQGIAPLSFDGTERRFQVLLPLYNAE